MYVIKRNGNREPVYFDKITTRIQRLFDMEPKLDSRWVDPVEISQKVVQGVYSGVTTSELDVLAAETAFYRSSTHPDFGKLASRIAVSNLHKTTPSKFSECIEILHSFFNKKTNTYSPLISDETYSITLKYAEQLDEYIKNNRDYTYDYFGFKTLERSYLLKVEGKIVERPQYLLMRVSIGIQGDDLPRILETYDYLSKKAFTHATPTLFNSGTVRPQNSSCFLMQMKDDSIEGIYDTLKNCAIISKHAGGIGIAVSNIRAAGTYIAGTNGISNGLIPMLKVFNETARYVDQCFPGDTRVYGMFGTKEISNIRVGDYVRTHLNNYKEVTKVMKYTKTDSLLEIHIENGKKILVTTLHPFLAVKRDGSNKITQSLKLGFKTLDWIEAQNLDVGDYIAHLAYSSILATQDEIPYKKYILNKVVFMREFTPENPIDLYDLEVDEDHSYLTEIGLVHNGGGKRKGSFAVYLEPYHSDIFEFLDLRKNTGKEELRARDLFLALWVPDLFMKRVENDADWTLLCPHECPGLDEVYGEEFESLYTRYENEKRGRKTIKARQLWNKIIESQIETGTPYILYKDSCNRKSNQNNLGTIKCSNLCVHPSTKILTKQGHIPIVELVEKEVEIWNGFEWSTVKPFKTGENQEMYKVVFSNGAELICTGYHKFYIDKFENNIFNENKNGILTLECKDLKQGMLIPFFETPDEYFEITRTQIKIESVELLSERSDTYCFNELKLHAGIFNGVLTGNCTEVIQYVSKDEISVCNLASIALPYCIKDTSKGKEFDHQELYNITRVITYNLNKIIDRNYYPVIEAKNSNLRHRPIGIGVQGLADVFMILRYPFDSKEAKTLNRDIFETIYYAALTESCDLAKKAVPYLSYEGSMISKGILQFDLWDQKSSDRWNWDILRENIKLHGVRNSLLIAPMPTASTSQILGWNECFEPYTSNIYTRRTLSGEFTVVNKHLILDLISMNLWTPELKNKIIANGGSVYNIKEIPNELREIYKTVWEIKQKDLIDMAADRGCFIDQSQSFNVFIAEPTVNKLSSMHFYGWKKGLKTGMYYLRTRPAANAIQFTVDKEMLSKNESCSRKEGCITCSS